MKFSMTGQERGDCLIQVTIWAGLTVSCNYSALPCNIELNCSCILIGSQIIE
jgi:hypothetical protein